MKKSIYRNKYDNFNNNIIGYDYKSSILLHKFISPIFLNNSIMYKFTSMLNDYFNLSLDILKYYQFFNNYTINKHDKNINI